MLLEFPKDHARVSAGSAGYKSGRSSERGTPVILSTARTRSGGTSSHCEMAWIDTPSGVAKPAKPPTFLIASSNAFDASLMVGNSSMALDQSQASLHCTPKVVLYAIVMTLGKRIYRARKRLDMTQDKLGEVFNITGQAVSQWERDKERPGGVSV